LPREKRLRAYLLVGFLTAAAVAVILLLPAKEPPVYPTRSVTIPEGYNIYQIDRLLFENKIISEEGSLVSLSPDRFGDYWFLEGTATLEGFLFPDTYEFYEQSSPEVVARKMLDNWRKKASLFFINKEATYNQIIVASLVEKEIGEDQEERALVAGVIFKRLRNDMPLQIDATLCYIKDKFGCGQVVPSDKEEDSPYNTYKNKGLPPAPISNPGLSAIKAAVSPKNSGYWYFISDPETGKTVFAKTLDEHAKNIVKYLR
jgi:UPF0755 protein